MQAPIDQPIKPQNRGLVQKSLLSFSKYHFPSIDKVHSSDTPNDAALLARALCEAAPSGLKDESRAYLVAEDGAVRWTAADGDVVAEGEEPTGRLEITGTVRGGALSADRLVHIPGHGDFQVESVCCPVSE